MDISQYPTTSTAIVAIPKVDESCGLNNKPPKERLIEFLDTLEGHTEKLRKDASVLEENKDQLLLSLDSVRTADIMNELSENDKDDVNRYADRIVNRCHTVEIKVLTMRDAMQEEALNQVNFYIDNLVVALKTDLGFAKSKCKAYMNACSSNLVPGITDKQFESALLGCTVDDQKRIKKRLQGLLNYLDRLNVTSIN